LKSLNQIHVDTGMGLERLVAVLNGSESNYDTDLFVPLFDVIHSFSSRPSYFQSNSNEQFAYRLLADHARMFTIAIADGLVPEKKGIGGLVKKMIERATRIAQENLQIDEKNVSILSKLIPHVTKILSPAYPELNEKVQRTVDLVKHCELNYVDKYEKAKPLLEKFIADRRKTSSFFVSAEEIFRLYGGKFDQINVPLEMIEEYSRLNPSFTFDWTNFDELMREETRKSQLFSIYNKTLKTSQINFRHPTDKLSDLIAQYPSILPTIDEPFKYEAERSIDAKIQLIVDENLDVVQQKFDAKRKFYVVLDRTNFYSTSGGQTSDRGTLEFADNCIFHVDDVFQLQNEIFHFGRFERDGNVSQPIVKCHVDLNRRKNLNRNHTATHLVHKVLRELLDDPNLIQKASLVDEEFFLFEFSTIGRNSSKTLFEDLEKRVNELIQLDLPVTTSFHDFNEIRSNSNIFRLTNESYPSRVRCLTIGDEFSRELCCGTHVRSTKEIEDFLLVRVDSKGQSNKRIYCLTGSFAENVRKSFENDFLRRFERLENERERIPIDELFSECQNLRETFLDERSLNFPQNQREKFYSRWQNLMPDKKIVEKISFGSTQRRSNATFHSFECRFADL